jgi:hypothetical protein
MNSIILLEYFIRINATIIKFKAINKNGIDKIDIKINANGSFTCNSQKSP